MKDCIQDLEHLRMRADSAYRQGDMPRYQMLRGLVDALIDRLQKKGEIRCLDFEESAGSEQEEQDENAQ